MARLFVAIEIPQALASALLARVPRVAGIRPAALDQIHRVLAAMPSTTDVERRNRALIDAVYYTTFNGAAGMPQLVDDGTRANDRAHPVGASATMLLRSGLPTVLYQDGMNADVMMAQPSGATTWMPSTFASGVPLDGFYIAGAGGTAVWGTLDHSTDPIMNLTVKSVP